MSNSSATNKRLFQLSIIRHIEGKSTVFSTFSMNCCDNLSHKFIVCMVEVNSQMKVNEIWTGANHVTNTFVVLLENMNNFYME